MSAQTHIPCDTRPFSREGQRIERRRHFFGFTFSGYTEMGVLADLYGLRLRRPERACSVSEFLSRNCRERPQVGRRIMIGAVELVVQETADGVLSKIGVALNRLDCASSRRH
ncbi:MAG: hypothetical protein ACREUW_17200 [Burkholderiales bacterium]